MQYKHKAFHQAGCGTRKLGKAYVYTPGLAVTGEETLEELFRALGEYIYDPPIPVDVDEMKISTQGLSIYQAGDGTYHALDWIGQSQGYENPADILIEFMFKDGSTLVPITRDLERFTPGESKRILVHGNGYIENPEILHQNRIEVPGVPICFLNKEEFPEHVDMHINDESLYCASFHWQCVLGTEKSKDRLSVRTVGDQGYACARPPKDFKPVFVPAMIAGYTMAEIHLVVGNQGRSPKEINDEIQKAMESLGKLNLNLPLYLTDN